MFMTLVFPPPPPMLLLTLLQAQPLVLQQPSLQAFGVAAA